MRISRWKIASRLLLCLLSVVVITGCPSTKVMERQILEPQRKLARPDRILVYDFAATPADVPADSALVGHPEVEQTPQTAEQIETGRRVGDEMSAALVEELRSLGLPAERASTHTAPQLNDIVIRGYLLSVEEGSRAKRMAIGFDSGASHLSVAAEGYQMTVSGLRKLGSGTLEAGGGKGPGAAAPLAVVLATGNPVGLVVGGGIKAYGEMSGKSKIEGRAKDAAKAIVEEMKPRLRQQGWIE